MLTCQYVPKDQAIFNKGDIGDAAYLILHGSVQFLNTRTLDWVGAEESSILNDKIQSEIEQATSVKVALGLKNPDTSTFDSLMIETKVSDFDKGRLFGEIALVDQSKNPKRILSARALTDCILIRISKDVFDMILKEKFRRERD